MLETIVCTFDISNSFPEWVTKFDKAEAPAREAKGIKIMFRGVAKDNPSKVVVIVQAEEGVLPKYIQENYETLVANGALMYTAVAKAYSQS